MCEASLECNDLYHMALDYNLAAKLTLLAPVVVVVFKKSAATEAFFSRLDRGLRKGLEKSFDLVAVEVECSLVEPETI